MTPAVAGIPYRYVALGLVCFGTLLASIDASIVVIAMPTLAKEFNTSTGNILWVSLTFVLLTTALPLSMGRLGDLYGRKRFYAIGFALFTASTVFAALSGSLPELLAARVVQAVGASLVIATGTAILAATFAPHERGQALGWQAASVGAGMALGPVLGGVMIEVLDWRAIFWTRIPLGVVGALLVWRFLIDSPPEERPRGLDIRGSLLLIGMLFTLVLGINRGQVWGWSSAPIVSLFALTAVALPLFLWVQQRAASPVLVLNLFRLRSFAAGNVAIMLQFAGFAAMLFMLPFYLVDARGFSTLEAGGVTAGFALSLLVVSPISGALADRTSPRVVMIVGLGILIAGLASLSTVGVNTPVAGIVVRLMLVGAGTALFQSPNMAVILSEMRAERVGTAAGAVVTFRNIGQSVGIAVGGALFAAQAASYANAHSRSGLDDPTVRAEAFVSGFELAMLVAAAVATMAIGAAWLSGSRRARRR